MNRKWKQPDGFGLPHLAGCLAIILFSTASSAQTNYERARLLPRPWAEDSHYSSSVAVSGDRVLISAPGPLDETSGFPWGGRPRKVFVQDATSGQLLLQLEANDGAAVDGFGWSIAAEGSSAVIGAPFDADLGFHSGSVYHFDLYTGQELAKFHAIGGNARDYFGAAADTDGSLALIGAPGDAVNGLLSGAAYVVDLSTGLQRFRLDSRSPERGARFGSHVAIGNGIAVVSSEPVWNGSLPTARRTVYVFDATTGQLLHELRSPHPGPEYGFGVAVAISGSRILVGEPLLYDLPAIPNGSVHVYDSVTGQRLHELVGPSVDETDGFGTSLATDGDLAVIGAPTTRVSFRGDGAAYVFDSVTGVLRTRLTSSTPTASPSYWDGGEPWGIRLGGSVAYDGGLIAAGSLGLNLVGACYVFEDTVVNSGLAFCFGDGSDLTCPCGTDGFLGEGCRSSAGRGGLLQGAGNADVTDDQLRLLAFRLPQQTPLFLLQGNTQPAQVFGEGLLCSNVTFRYSVQYASSTGSAVFEGLGRRASPGSTLLYQCWYRDQASTCGLGGFNLTNGWAVTW